MADRSVTLSVDDSALVLAGGADTLGKGTGPALGSTAGDPNQTKKKAVHTEGFRGNNVRFLQDQNKEVLRALEKLEAERDEARALVEKWEERKAKVQQEYQKLQHQLADTQEKSNFSAAEIQKRDEQIRVLSEQNRSLLDMLEVEEKAGKELENAVNDVRSNQERLQHISDQFDKIHETGNQQLTSAFTEIAKFEEDYRNAQNETAQLQEAEQNFLAQAKVDVESLEQKLNEAKTQNVDHLQQIQHNEVHEHRLTEALHKLKELIDELGVQKKGIRIQLDMDVDHKEKWTQSKGEVERRKETLEKTVEALRASLRSAEDHNSRMQDDNKQGADNFRALGDKVYSLMDQLRLAQTELKKLEHSGTEKARKITVLDKQSQSLQQNLQIEVDAKLAAESDARSAAQMQALLHKKNKMLEEALQLALRAQEKVEKRLQELHDKSNALQAQNEYLGTRIDGNEEDKGALRRELRRMEDEMRQATAAHSQLTQQHTELDDKVNDVAAEKAALRAELDYIKREDMLDETGRTKPILIESESKLIQRLQINEFLFSAQQTRNPIPMLIEKVSHLLELLHTSQTQADLYLQDLQRSNSMLTALRGKNMSLYEKVEMCETWKMRALLKIASNAFENRQNVKGHNSSKSEVLYLDGLQYSYKELQELNRVITNYGKQDSVKEVRLQDNALARPSVPHLCELLDLCPYLNRLDLKRNKLDDNAISDLMTFVERIPGTTSVQRDPVSGDIRAMAGKQVRLVINLEEQGAPPEGEDAQVVSDDLMEEPAGAAADQFLASAAGLTAQTRLQGPDAPGKPPGAGGLSRNMSQPQRGNAMSASGSLPKIASAGSPGPALRR